jgi:MFS family permease
VYTEDQTIEQPTPQAPPLSRNRDFTLLWTGQAISSLGTQMSTIAFPLLVLIVTGSAGRAGLVGSAELIAMLAALLPAGVTADRRPRKRIMVVSSLVQLAALGTVAVAVATHHVYLVLLATAGAVEGAAQAYYLGASRGAVRRLVPEGQLSQALTRTQARDQAAALAGPPAGGALFALSRSLPFALDAASFGVIALAAALVRGEVDPQPSTSAADEEPVLRRVTRGVRHVAGHRYLRTAAAWSAAINAVSAGMMLIFIVLARYRGAGPSAIGGISAAFAVGGVAGALLTPRLTKRYSGRGLVLVASWIFAGSAVGMALVPVAWPIAIFGALCLCSLTPTNVILLTRAYELTPHEMQGRTGNAMLLVGQSLSWPAPAVFGFLADRFGAVDAALVGAGLYALTAAWLHTRAELKQLDVPVAQLSESAA